jgi:hypothetical protein
LTLVVLVVEAVVDPPTVTAVATIGLLKHVPLVLTVTVWPTFTGPPVIVAPLSVT